MIFALLLLIAGVLTYIYFDDLKAAIAQPENPKGAALGYNDEIDRMFRYVGAYEEAFVLKGKLLDASYQKEYDALPDTLYKMMYGDRILCVDCDNGNSTTAKWYTWETKGASEEKLKTMYPKPTRELDWIKYTILADKGKVEYPSYAPLYLKNGITCNLVAQDKFSEGYNLFDKGPALSDIPLLAKIKILQFLNSEGNRNFKIERGDQPFNDLVVVTDLTKKEQRDVAIVFREISEGGIHERYKLLVYAYSRYNGEYYILYNENFYEPVVIASLNASFEYGIYMNSGEKAIPHFPPLMVKQQGRPDVALVYDKEFDKMVPYIQMKKSEEEKEENEITIETKPDSSYKATKPD